jgi:hypothetical protein
MRGVRAVLDLDPFAAAPRAIAAIAALGDDPLEPHDACLLEDDRAVRGAFKPLSPKPHRLGLGGGYHSFVKIGEQLCWGLVALRRRPHECGTDECRSVLWSGR